MTFWIIPDDYLVITLMNHLSLLTYDVEKVIIKLIRLEKNSFWKPGNNIIQIICIALLLNLNFKSLYKSKASFFPVYEILNVTNFWFVSSDVTISGEKNNFQWKKK